MSDDKIVIIIKQEANMIKFMKAFNGGPDHISISEFMKTTPGEDGQLSEGSRTDQPERGAEVCRAGENKILLN